MQNYPLFLKTVSSEKDLTFYYTVHTSLDVVEEKISSVAKSTNDLRELYLGLLYPMEDYRVYPCVVCSTLDSGKARNLTQSSARCSGLSTSWLLRALVPVERALVPVEVLTFS